MPAIDEPLPFGKYRGRTLQQLAAGHGHERGYVDWMAREFNAEAWRRAAADALDDHVRIQQPAPLQYVLDVCSATKASLRCPYDQRVTTLLRDRIDGINWNRKAAQWEFSRTQLAAAAAFLETIGIVELTPAAAAARQEELDRRTRLDSIRHTRDTDMEIPTRLPLFGFQRVGVEFAVAAGGRALIADEMGCVDGHALVQQRKHGVTSVVTLHELYADWNPHVLTECFALRGDTFGFQRVTAVLDKGVRRLLKLTTSTRRVIRVTPDHELLLESGVWLPAEELQLGQRLRVYDAHGPAETLEHIEQDGDGQVYDLVMEDPHRNFVANGFVVHNCGKTTQAIGSALVFMRDQGVRRILTVCPASLKVNWYREWLRFAGLEATIWHGSKIDGDLDALVHIINYDIFGKYRSQLEGMGFDFLIADEAHYLKNKDSLRTQAIFGGFNRRTKTRLPAFKVPYAVLLTGTPVLNRPGELFPLLHYLAPDRFNDWFSFANRYGAWAPMNLEGRPWKPQNLNELHERTKDIVIRRKKVDVLPDLPPKLVSDVFVELTREQRKAYNSALGEVAEQWKTAAKEKRKPTLNELQKLTSLLNEIKLDKVRELIDELQNEDDVRPVLVFSTRLDPLRTLQQEYGARAMYIDGSMSPDERQLEVDRFQRGDATIALLSLRAAGVGLTLTNADTVIFIDQDFVPANHLQAEDRAHRIGQVNPVQIYYLLAEDTVDEDLRALLAEKTAVTSQIADGAVQELTRQQSLFTDFVRRLKRRYKQFAALEDAA